MRWANDVEFGLASSVWTTGPRPGHADGQEARFRLCLDQHPHPARGRDAPRRLQALGYGKDLSVYGFEDYTRIKHVIASNGPEGDPPARPGTAPGPGRPASRCRARRGCRTARVPDPPSAAGVPAESEAFRRLVEGGTGPGIGHPLDEEPGLGVLPRPNISALPCSLITTECWNEQAGHVEDRDDVGGAGPVVPGPQAHDGVAPGEWRAPRRSRAGRRIPSRLAVHVAGVGLGEQVDLERGVDRQHAGWAAIAPGRSPPRSDASRGGGCRPPTA